MLLLQSEKQKDTTSLWSQSKRRVRRINRRLATVSICIWRQFESDLFSDLLHAIVQVVSNREFKHCVVSLGKTLHSLSMSLHQGF